MSGDELQVLWLLGNGIGDCNGKQFRTRGPMRRAEALDDPRSWPTGQRRVDRR